MRALYVLQQHVALCGVECKALLIVAGLFVAGLAATQLRAEPLPYDDAFYAAEAAEPSGPAPRAAATGSPAQAPTRADSSTSADTEGADGAQPEPASAQPEARPSRAAARMNLNTASARLLTQLPGIGPKKAAAVVAYRDEHGAFGAVEDLQRVRGIGPKTVAKLAPMLFVEAPAEQIAAN